MSKFFRLRVSAIALALASLACAAPAAAADPKTVDVAVQSHAFGSAAKAAAKPSVSAVPSPVMFEVKGRLDAHGHVTADCLEVENPKFNAARERGRRTERN